MVIACRGLTFLEYFSIVTRFLFRLLMEISAAFSAVLFVEEFFWIEEGWEIIRSFLRISPCLCVCVCVCVCVKERERERKFESNNRYLISSVCPSLN